MENRSYSHDYQYGKISLACFTLCVILLALLGLLPIVNEQVTLILRPLFIGVCMVSLGKQRYYPFGAAKWHVLQLIYFTLIFLVFSITGQTARNYGSAALYMLFFFFAAFRIWNAREIKLIIYIVIFATIIFSLGLLYSNHGLSEAGDGMHIDYFGKQINRNAPAYAIAIGAMCSAFSLFYDHKCSRLTSMIYMFSFGICSYVVVGLSCRGAFFSVVAAVLIILWQVSREEKNEKTRFKRRLFILISLLLILVVLAHVTEGKSSHRLFVFGEEFDDSGRSALRKEAMKMVLKKPVFGGGFGYWYTDASGLSCHNSFVAWMLFSGFVGGGILVLFYLATIVNILKVNNYIPLAFFMETLLHSWSETSMDYYAYFPLIITFILYNYLKYTHRPLRTIF